MNADIFLFSKTSEICGISLRALRVFAVQKYLKNREDAKDTKKKELRGFFK